MMFPKFHDDMLTHIQEVLRRSDSVLYGRKEPKTWQVGNLRASPTSEWITARLGATRRNISTDYQYDERTREWVGVPNEREHTILTPLALLSDMRILAILAHPEMTDITAARVLTDILNNGERKLPIPTTDWAVEPMLDDREFEEWIRDADRVTNVKFVFKRPNPDGAEDLELMQERLVNLKAESIAEEIKAANPEVGLDKQALTHDRYVARFRSAAVRTFATVTARGFSNNSKIRFNQKKSAARTTIKKPANDWDGIEDQTIAAARIGRSRMP